MVRSLLEAWPSRRRLAAAALLPLVAAWFVTVGGSGRAAPSVYWFAVVAVAATLAAGVLASYVPVVGRRPDLGCTPCATMSALTVVAATVALRSYGAELTGPVLAVAVLLFGLAQRLSQPPTCVTGPVPAAGDPPRQPPGVRT